MVHFIREYRMISDKHRGRCCLDGSLTGLLILGVLIFLIGACASSPAAVPDKETGQGMAVVPVEPPGLFGKPSFDAMTLNEGVSWMGLSDQPADYAKAREIFTALTKNYPQSRWRPLAETFIRQIDTIASLQAKNLSAQELTEKLQQDNSQLKQDKEQLKKDIQALSGKFQAERDSLLQENEQLKKDMELLKKLEVQLDHREKMLR
jgi:FtsZ-binding cell division protein ZapB